MRRGRQAKNTRHRETLFEENGNTLFVANSEITFSYSRNSSSLSSEEFIKEVFKAFIKYSFCAAIHELRHRNPFPTNIFYFYRKIRRNSCVKNEKEDNGGKVVLYISLLLCLLFSGMKKKGIEGNFRKRKRLWKTNSSHYCIVFSSQQAVASLLRLPQIIWR